MSTKIEDMSDAARPRAQVFVTGLKSGNIDHAVTCTKRTDDEQLALWLQGRDVPLEIVNLFRRRVHLRPLGLGENTYKVTNCNGIDSRSPHQDGDAMDVVPAVNGNPIWPPLTDPRWKQIAEIGEAAGFEWGGRWANFPDAPHYQLP